MEARFELIAAGRDAYRPRHRRCHCLANSPEIEGYEEFSWAARKAYEAVTGEEMRHGGGQVVSEHRHASAHRPRHRLRVVR